MVWRPRNVAGPSRQRPDSIYVRQPTNRMGVVWLLRSTFDKAVRLKSPELAVVREALAGQRRIYAVSRKKAARPALMDKKRPTKQRMQNK